jgi:hypothetical protein
MLLIFIGCLIGIIKVFLSIDCMIDLFLLKVHPGVEISRKIVSLSWLRFWDLRGKQIINYQRRRTLIEVAGKRRRSLRSF